MLPGNQILESLELLAMVKPDEQSIAEPQEKVNAGFRGRAERNRRWDCNYLSPEKNAS